MRVVQRTFAFMSSKRKTPDLLREVGCGRRVRGSANLVNMMGGILPEKQNESMIWVGQNYFAWYVFRLPKPIF
jgi:hypothetical protein